MDTIEYATFLYDVAEVENGLKRGEELNRELRYVRKVGENTSKFCLVVSVDFRSLFTLRFANFLSSQICCKVHNETHKQVCKQSLLLPTK